MIFVLYALSAVFILLALIFCVRVGADVGVMIKNIGKVRAPFVDMPERAVERLVSTVGLSASDVVYDLGCGDGRILCALCEKNPHAHYVGIEYNLWAYLSARVRTFRFPHISIRYADIFSADISDATVFVVYLFPEVIDEFVVRRGEEVKGRRLYSVDFPCAHCVPVEVIGIDQKTARGKRIYVYEM